MPERHVRRASRDARLYDAVMRFLMRQKVWSFADDFTIKDEAGADVARVVGRVFSFGDKLTFFDLAGAELARIEQVMMSWGPTYEIHRGGQLAAVVKKKLFTLFRTEFTVDVPGPNDLIAEGDFTDHEYTFQRSGTPVARVSKQWFAWSDTYGIELADGEDPLLIIASTVVIDMVLDRRSDDD